nr:RNA-directed DNA polymerase, eukaryota, reverse transcriptase zinc-binding domain protein [Tanacetum cinerariifolium]
FWLDTWTLDSPLYVRFPRLFALKSVKDISVAVKWGAPTLDASFRRRARDGAESNQWSEFCSMLDSVTLSSSSNRIFCDLNGEVRCRKILITCFSYVTWVKVYLKEFVVGGIFGEWRTRCMLNGIAGLSLSVCRLSSNSCWRVFFIHLCGISGPSGTGLSLILLRLEEL